MAFSLANLGGLDLNNAAQVQATSYYASTPAYVPNQGPLGAEVFGSDGKRYVFAKANATISASTTTCDINTTTFLVAATGGAYTSPPVDLVSGDYAWFGKASV